MRKIAKYGIALFVLACLLNLFFPSCSGICAAFVAGDKVKALIAQLQGRCCTYEIKRTEENPFGFCYKKSEPYVPIPLLPYRCVSWAAECLGEMGKQAREAVPALIQALETGPNNFDTGDGPISPRDEIIIALGKSGDPRAVKPLIAAIYSTRPVDASWTTRPSSGKLEKPYAPIEALGLMGSVAHEAVPHIIPFLKNSDPYLFRAAAKALGQIKDPRTIPALLEALNHPTDASLAAEALGEFGAQAKPAVPILVKMIERSPNREGSFLVIDAIRKISGNKDYLPAFNQNTTKGWSQINAIADKHIKHLTISIPDNKGLFYIALPNEEKLYVKLKHTAANPSSEAGEIWLEKNGKKSSTQTFSTFRQMRHLFSNKLTTRLPKLTQLNN